MHYKWDGWSPPPHQFGGDSETARDVAATTLNIDAGKPAKLLAQHGHERYVKYPQEDLNQGQNVESTVMTVYKQQKTGGMGCTCTPTTPTAIAVRDPPAMPITPKVMTVYEPPAKKPSTALTVYRPVVTTVTLYTYPMRDWVNLEVYVDDYIAMAQILEELPYITILDPYYMAYSQYSRHPQSQAIRMESIPSARKRQARVQNRGKYTRWPWGGH
jgi:hypothetical protein